MRTKTLHLHSPLEEGTLGSPTLRRRSGGRSARVQAAVFNATLIVLEECGYEATSIAEIAKRAGVNETSIYRRWKTREALLVEALLARTQEVIPIPDTGMLHTDILQLLYAVRSFFQSPLGEAITRLMVSTVRMPELASARQTFWKSRFSSAASVFERAVQRGELSPSVNHELLLEIILGPFYVRLLVTGQPLDDLFLQDVVDFLTTCMRQRM